jgi:cyclophilin family peptidyl-prolyl cis-trans isomerase/HEAT repeat protein
VAARPRGGAHVVKTRRLGLALAALLLACSRAPSSDTSRSATASGSTASQPPQKAARLGALLAAEHRRASAEVTPEDLANPDASVRRAAARALARIGDARAAELLTKTIGDEDAEVISWSAFGLGTSCNGRETGAARTLAARAASLLARQGPVAAEQKVSTAPATPALLPPLASIAVAFGRCGGPEAERTLSAWLSGPPALAEHAALALGAIAVRTGRLEDASLVELLSAASRASTRVPEALHAFARLGTLSDPVRMRLLEVARGALASAGPQRSYAVRALASAGDGAAPELARVVGDPTFTVAERADAARSLGRLGSAGQKALGEAVAKLLEDPAIVSNDHLLGANYGALLAALDALESPGEKAAPALGKLAELPFGNGKPLERRTIALRCRAAAILAGKSTLSPRLTACDKDPGGREGNLALLKVLARGELKGARLARYQELAASSDAVVRQRALKLLNGHAEVRGAPAMLASALASRSPGVVATAAEVLSSYPDRASPERAAGAPDPAVVKALGDALESWKLAPMIEVRSALAGAAGALQLLGAKPRLEAECASDNPTLRETAEKALRLLGDATRRCDTEVASAVPNELSHLLKGPVRLDFETDVGRLYLDVDPTLAPVAATRVADLARTAFYNLILVHRVVPGFVVQLGDRGGDGYGGAPRPALRSELSPAEFEPGSVGIALGGKDSGSSQFFVTLGRHPHLDGQYALIGKAGPGWERLTEWDMVKKVSVGSVP